MPDTIGHTASTSSTINVGGTTVSAVDFSGDHDWFRISLSAGQAITVTLNGITLVDPILRIFDSLGNEIHVNDDINPGVNLDSKLSFAATTSGFYYIDVGAWDNSGAGDYQLTVTAFQTPPVWTNDQIAYQLHSGYWGDGQHPFNVSSGGSLTVNITGLNGAGQALARQALQTWNEITGISFVESTSATPNIMFTDDDPDGGAFTEGLAYSGNFVTRALVNIDTSWLTDFGSTIGSYGYQTYLHEIGHALGLGHAGNYNETATYPYDALYQNDSWATSVMSYFHQTESTYFSNQGFSRLNLVTPMVADILAVQDLYGLSTTTRSGNTTYGFNATSGINPVYNAQQYSLSTVAYTVFDAGGTDTLDYSNYSVAQRIDLNSEQFSNIGGKTGNVTIARGTIIENAVGGSGADTMIGNSAANVLTGRAGPDRLTGGFGNDTFQDTRAGLSGDTITDFAAGDRIVFTDATLAGFTFSLSGSTLTYSGGSLTLSGVTGRLFASAAAGGGVQISAAGPTVRSAGDFNGDGRSDLLLRHTNGWMTEWLGQANGSFSDNGAVASKWTHPDWQVAGIGDFNGDGRDDALLRDPSGWMTEWLGQANGSFSDNGAVASKWTHPDWQVAGIGDFNGDGRSDLLLRHSSGSTTEWLGQANGSFSDNGAVAGNWAHPDWQVAGTGDFNGDGRSDLLLRHTNGWMTEWLGQTNGSFSDNGAVASSWTHPLWQLTGIGDFNGDSRDDVLLRHSDGTMVEWLGQANGAFASNGAGTSWLHPAWSVASTGDFNGDSRDDLLLRHSDGTMVEWVGQANGSFSANNAASSWVESQWQVQPVDIF